MIHTKSFRTNNDFSIQLINETFVSASYKICYSLLAVIFCLPIDGDVFKLLVWKRVKGRQSIVSKNEEQI